MEVQLLNAATRNARSKIWGFMANGFKRFKIEVTIFVRPGTYTNVCVSKDGKLPGKNYLPGC